jgi:RimJ/RimL family protein N-acetyltransferase
VRVRRSEGALGLRERSAIELAPLFGLRLRTARLELRLPEDDEIEELARLVERGIHEPEAMPFRTPWTDRAGTPGFVSEFTGFHRSAREAWQPGSWNLLLGVWAGGEPIGVQDVRGPEFATTRVADTGSWLGREHQGQGHGTEMRFAVLELVFRGLGARAATSGAFEDNPASLRVSEKVGYLPDGEAYYEVRGERRRELCMRLTRERWKSLDRPPVEIAGLEPCLPLFGL